MGHLSSQCPSNTHGIYVNGGECKQCGSNLHTSKQCPQREDVVKKKEKSVTGLPEVDGDALLRLGGEGGGDDMPELYKSRNNNDGGKQQQQQQDEKKSAGSPKKAKRRVVNF